MAGIPPVPGPEDPVVAECDLLPTETEFNLFKKREIQVSLADIHVVMVGIAYFEVLIVKGTSGYTAVLQLEEGRQSIPDPEIKSQAQPTEQEVLVGPGCIGFQVVLSLKFSPQAIGPGDGKCRRIPMDRDPECRPFFPGRACPRACRMRRRQCQKQDRRKGFHGILLFTPSGKPPPSPPGTAGPSAPPPPGCPCPNRPPGSRSGS